MGDSFVEILVGVVIGLGVWALTALLSGIASRRSARVVATLLGVPLDENQREIIDNARRNQYDMPTSEGKRPRSSCGRAGPSGRKGEIAPLRGRPGHAHHA